MPTWPDIPYPAWADTAATLHRWTQVAGKYRLARTPWQNHSWHVPLYVSARGLTTSVMPDGARDLELEFDFVDHVLLAKATDGQKASLALEPMSVAEFHTRFIRMLDGIGAATDFHGTPNEIPDAKPFAEDHEHASYDPDAVHRFWQALVRMDRVFKHFRTGFLGKVSPVHFFWGSFDMAVTRFSGRPAPKHPGGVPKMPDDVAQEAYSHEVSSAGFWPGGGPIDYPAFYSYAYPGPDGFADAAVKPAAATWSEDLGEFLLPYDAVRTAPDPDGALLEFLQTTYVAAADRGKWDRAALDAPLGAPGVVRQAY